MDDAIKNEQIEMMSKTIFRFCLSRTGSYHDAEDLAQEIMLVACRRENRFDTEKSFCAFVWKTADNLLRTWYRRRARQPLRMPDAEEEDRRYAETEERAQDHEQLRLILAELARLSSDCRRAAVAYYIDEMPVREIARRLSRSESMVKYLLFQSRKRIREGISMEKTSGRLSLDPVELSMFFWGGKNRYFGIFEGNRLRQNIVMACYYDRLTEEQLSLQLGVPAAYLERDLKKLLEYDLIREKGKAFQSNILIVTARELGAIRRRTEPALRAAADGVSAFIDENTERTRAVGFYGSDMSLNSLRWMLLSLILRRAYVEMLQKQAPPDLPTDFFGDRCFRFLVEMREDDPYFMGVSSWKTEEGEILFWDVPVNGEMVHPKTDLVRADMLISLTDRRPSSENEKLVCAELVELGLAKKEKAGILPCFPCLDASQSAALRALTAPIAESLCAGAVSRLGAVADIMKEHAPEPLSDYAVRLPALIALKETEVITRILCESGWLIPLRDGMLATTVMMKSR